MATIQSIKTHLLNLGPRHPATRAALATFGALKGYSTSFNETSIKLSKQGKGIIISNDEVMMVPMMLDHFDLYHRTVEPNADGGRTIDFSRPLDHKYKRSGFTLSCPAIAEDDAIDMYLRKYTPPPGSSVFDLGANAGLTSLELSRVVGPEGRVFAFEPDIRNRDFLCRNLKRNNVSNVIVYPYAISDTTGIAQFKMSGTVSSGLVGAMLYSECDNSVAVETLTLADACDRAGTVPDFVKVDIEGAEVGLVQGAATFLKSNRIAMAFESGHPLADGSLTFQKLEPMLRSIGYVVSSEPDAGGTMFTWALPSSAPLVE
jgi:FkbM family methyltransferase